MDEMTSSTMNVTDDVMGVHAETIRRSVEAAASSLETIYQPMVALLVQFKDSSQLHWNLGYCSFIVWLYLFHAPLKNKERIDIYAQITKIVQVWFGLHITLFHMMSSFIQEWKSADITKLFFPLFVSALMTLALMHKAKRPLGLRLTFAPTFTMLFLNSLLVAMTFTVHATYCFHLHFSYLNLATTPADISAAEAAELSDATVVRRLVQVACPNPFYSNGEDVTEIGRSSWVLFHLFVLSVAIMWIDYAYKRICNYDPLRGVFWAAEVEAKKPRPGIDTPDGEEMVSWYSMVTSLTGIQLFIKSNLNFLTFDFRGVEEGITPKVFRIREWKKESSSIAPRDRSESPMPELQAVGGGDNLAATSSSPQLRSTGKLYSATRVPSGSGARKKTPSPPPQSCEDDGNPFNFTGKKKAAVGDGEKIDFWFDFVADVGDGYNSTYAVANLLAQPELHINSRGTGQAIRKVLVEKMQVFREKLQEQMAANAPPVTPHTPARRRTIDKLKQSVKSFSAAAKATRVATPTSVKKNRVTLPRGQLVVVGGDLCYPNPTEEGYRKRFFRPYDDALPKCSARRKDFVNFVHPDDVDPDLALLDSVPQLECVARGQELADRVAKKVAEKGEDEQSTTVSNPSLPPPPAIFLIPGNHDWIDGAQTFRSMVLGKSWLGGWIMPQQSSYFVLELPGDWVLYCMDTGLFEDIDPCQMQYFLNYTDTKLQPHSSVILIHHEPMWIHDHHYREGGKKATTPSLASARKGRNGATGAAPPSPEKSGDETMVRTNKVARRLGKQLRMRLAGDIHNYSRYSPSRNEGAPAAEQEQQEQAPLLIVSGGGGAFMHGVHNYKKLNYLGAEYERSSAFPMKRNLVAMIQRVFGFRVVNWQFDLIGGLCYFMMVVSLLPLPLTGKGSLIENEGDELPDNLPAALACAVAHTFQLLDYVFSKSYVSAAVAFCAFAAHSAAMEVKVPFWKRILYGAFWGVLHIFSSVFLLSLMHVALQYMISYGMVLSTASKWDSSLQRRVAAAFFSTMDEACRLPYVGHIASLAQRNVIIPLSGTFVGDVVVFGLKSIDIVEGLVFLSHNVAPAATATGAATLGVWNPTANRLDCILYIAHLLWFYWVLATPVVSFFVGLWVVFSISVFDVGYDAAYAAFCVEDYKNFVRLWLTTDEKTGQVVCNCFVIGIERVPKMWKRASSAENTSPSAQDDSCGGNGVPGYCAARPSRWTPWKRRLPETRISNKPTDPVIVDQFQVLPTPTVE